MNTSAICIRELINGGCHLKATVIAEDCVPDEKDAINTILIKWCDVLKINLIFTLGGTGFSPRDGLFFYELKTLIG